jgi:hypothetical protein
MSERIDLCYLPTNGLCKINDVLDDSHFPSNKENIMCQELVTYERTDVGMKKTTFQRNFTSKSHYDSTRTEIFSWSK